MTTNRFDSVVLVLLNFVLAVTLSFPLPAGNLTFASEPNAQMMVQLRSPSKPTLDDPSLTSKVVSNNRSLGQLTEKALNTIHSPPTGPTRFHGAAWYGFAALALFLILITGLLAGLTLAVMSVDMTRLRVWTRTGSPKRQLVLHIPLFLGMLENTYISFATPSIGCLISIMFFQCSQFVLVCPDTSFTTGADIKPMVELRLPLF